MKKIKFLIPVILLLLVGCKKSNVDEYPEFKGFWVAVSSDARYEINVKDNGRATYEVFKSNTETSYRGRLIVEGEELKIGFKKLKINQFPLANTMILDEITYYKE
jgi:hypothetical protein